MTHVACNNDRMADETPNGWENPEAPWWAKLRRATKLLTDVGDACAAINADSTPCVQRVADGDQSWRYRVQVSRPIPADLAALVADAIHNMRSALDQVAYHLADRHVGGLTADQERRTEFPIKTTAEDFDGWMRERRRGELYGPNESRALRCVQPFALQEEAAGYGLTVGHDLTDDAAVVLNALWNLDKHRRLPRLCWGIVSPVWWSHPDPSVQYLWTSSLDEGKSLSDGMVIGKFRNLQDHGRPTTDPTIEFEIHLDDCRPYGPSSVTRTLDWLHRSICGWVIPRMFITAAGHEPPVMITFMPPVTPTRASAV